MTATLPTVAARAETGIATGTFDRVAGYTVLRLALGVSIFFHGLARFVGGFEKYAKPTIAGFAHTALPHGLVVLAVDVIPFAEFAIGALVLMGLFSRVALLANAALILGLMFGTCMQQNWTTLNTQMPYPIVIALLLFFLGYNAVSLDRVLTRSARGR
jgi:thiosulfate dehydrogenase [quinone] large subunit